MVYDARSVVLCSLILLPVVHICMYVCVVLLVSVWLGVLNRITEDTLF